MSGICPTCNKRAYDAESTTANGDHYHTRCFKCKQCKKALALSTASYKEKIPYCASCYGSLYGPSGFRGGGGSSTIGVVTHSAVDSGKGASSSSSSAGGKFCSKCGAKNTGGAFCSGCGAKA